MCPQIGQSRASPLLGPADSLLRAAEILGMTSGIESIGKSQVLGSKLKRCHDSEPELVFDDAEPDLSRVDGHFLTDEGVLGSGVHVAERTLEASALADRARAGDSPICGHIKYAANGLLSWPLLPQWFAACRLRSIYGRLVVADGRSV